MTVSSIAENAEYSLLAWSRLEYSQDHDGFRNGLYIPCFIVSSKNLSQPLGRVDLQLENGLNNFTVITVHLLVISICISSSEIDE